MSGSRLLPLQERALVVPVRVDTAREILVNKLGTLLSRSEEAPAARRLRSVARVQAFGCQEHVNNGRNPRLTLAVRRGGGGVCVWSQQGVHHVV